jgi:hypothetical protein
MFGSKWEVAAATIVAARSGAPAKRGTPAGLELVADVRRATGEVFRATIPVPADTPPLAPGAVVRVEIEVKTGNVRIAPLTAMSALRAVGTALKAAEQARLQGGYGAAGYGAAGPGGTPAAIVIGSPGAVATGLAGPAADGGQPGGLAAAALAARRQAMIAAYHTASPVVFTATGPVPAGPPPAGFLAFSPGTAFAGSSVPGGPVPGNPFSSGAVAGGPVRAGFAPGDPIPAGGTAPGPGTAAGGDPSPAGGGPGGSPVPGSPVPGSPVPGDQQASHAERLSRLQELRDQGLLSPAEYEQQRQRILNEL